MDSLNGRPERLILTAMLVPPVAIRPSVNMEAQGRYAVLLYKNLEFISLIYL